MRKNRMQNMMDGIELSEKDKQRILYNCLKGRHVHNKVFRYSKQIAAALAVGIVCTSSLSVYAAVSAYQAYMEKMSREEVQERYDNVQSGTKDADSFSRPLTETERDGLDQMRAEYQEGLRFPEKSMVCFDGAAAYEVNGEELSYDYTNAIFYLPERELTEEELLQIIDVWEKANYSLGVMNEEANEQGPTLEEATLITEQNKQPVEESQEEALERISSQVIENITGNDVTGQSWDIVLQGEINRQYIATLETEDGRYKIFYLEDSTAEDWTVDRYTYYAASESDGASTGYTEEEMSEKAVRCGTDAVTQLVDSFGIEEQVVKCEFGYMQSALTGESPWLDIIVTTDNGTRYYMLYGAETETVVEMCDYEVGQFDHIDLMDGYDVVGELE